MKKISFFFKESKPLAQLLGLFFIFLIGFIVSSGLQVLSLRNGVDPSAIRTQMLIQGASQLLMFFVPAWLFACLYHDGAVSFHKIKADGKSWILGLIAAVVFLLLVPLNDRLTSWNAGWNFGSLEQQLRSIAEASSQLVEKMLSFTSPGDLALQLVIVALLPAVCEELFFRGALQQTLHSWFGNAHVAIIATALIFTFAHGDVYGLVPRFLMGVVLGYLFYYSGSMIVNVCAHFFNNALIVVMYYLYHIGVLSQSPSEPMLMPWGTVLVCTVGAALLFAVYFLKKSTKQASKI